MATGDVMGSVEVPRWNLLESQPPSGERLTVRSALSRCHEELLIAVDAPGRRHILVEIPNGEPSKLSERTSRGIDVQTVEMKVEAGELRNFVDIICLEPQGHAALDIIVKEIADAIEGGSTISRVALVQNVLAKWRRFWSGISQPLLSREEHIGLFGELWFLSRWLGPSVGLATGVRMWRGPMGARNDFEAKLIGIEIKTSSRADAMHRINGLEQLMEPPGGSLLLMSIVVRDEASATNDLPTLIAEVRLGLANDFNALSHFDSCLYAARYEDALADEYAKLKLRIRAEELYRVVSEFPRLIPSSLKQPPAQGIRSVNYDLSLDGAAPWRIATSAVAGKKLLQDFVSP